MSDNTVLNEDRVEAIARFLLQEERGNFTPEVFNRLWNSGVGNEYRGKAFRIIAADPATPLLKECAEVMEEWKAADDYDGPLDKIVSRSIYHDAVTSRDALLERLRRMT